MIIYKCDRCCKQSHMKGEFYYETKDREDNTIHLCGECYAERQELDKRFMWNEKRDTTPLTNHTAGGHIGRKAE